MASCRRLDQAFDYLLDRAYGSKGGLLEHLIGELDAECILEREHDIYRRVRRQTEFVKVVLIVDLVWIDSHPTMSGQYVTDPVLHRACPLVLP
jgi:hypothetical protein